MNTKNNPHAKNDSSSTQTHKNNTQHGHAGKEANGYKNNKETKLSLKADDTRQGKQACKENDSCTHDKNCKCKECCMQQGKSASSCKESCAPGEKKDGKNGDMRKNKISTLLIISAFIGGSAFAASPVEEGEMHALGTTQNVAGAQQEMRTMPMATATGREALQEEPYPMAPEHAAPMSERSNRQASRRTGKRKGESTSPRRTRSESDMSPRRSHSATRRSHPAERNANAEEGQGRGRILRRTRDDRGLDKSGARKKAKSDNKVTRERSAQKRSSKEGQKTSQRGSYRRGKPVSAMASQNMPEYRD